MIKMERVQQMKDGLKEKKDFLLRKRCEKIEDMFINNIGNMQENFIKIIEELASERDGGSLVISYLRSSYILGNHEFYIAYYKEEPFVEEEPDCCYFNMSPILNGIEEDLKEMKCILYMNYIRVFAGEIEEIHRWYMEQIYLSFENVMKRMVGMLNIKAEISIYYGGYMDKLNIIEKNVQ